MVSVVAALVLFGQASPNQGKFEIGERLRELDHVWVNTLDKTRRTVALPKISQASRAILTESLAEACLALDEATAALLGRQAQASDAITLRFDPPYAEPRTPAKLRIGWAYVPSNPSPVPIQVGRQSLVATPGRGLTLDVRPEQVNPEILQNPEVGFLLPVQVGSEQRSVSLSIIKKPRERLASLKNTKMPEATALVRYLEKAFASPEDFDSDLPLIQYLFTAELLDEGRLRLDRADMLPLVIHKGTQFRANFPRQVRGPLTVVIALHGSEGTESLFYQAYGQGKAVSEAVKRNWAFIAPRVSESAIANTIDWIRTRRRQQIDKIFLIGHNSGAELALRSTTVVPRPRAIAAFAPNIKGISGGIESTPLFLSVGRQDALLPELRVAGQALSARRGSRYLELDNCDHFVVVGESLSEAYRFFDAYAGR